MMSVVPPDPDRGQAGRVREETVAVRLIAGRAGSGKTRWCQEQIRQALAASWVDGPPLILLTPEQAALQMERSLLAGAAAPVLGRCAVLSFRRLAHRILQETSGPTPAVLTATGRQMALRLLIARRRDALREFPGVADRGGFIAALSRGIAELLQEQVTVEQLRDAARQAAADGEDGATRLHDTAILYQAYLDYLGTERVDPEGVLDLARSRLTNAAAASAWPAGARIWVDGFAGFTEQQVRMITALARVAEDVYIALLLDPARLAVLEQEVPADELSLFARTERTWLRLVESLRAAGVTPAAPIVLGQDGCPRFADAPMLARLERDLFAVRTSGRGEETESPLAAAADPVADDWPTPIRLVRAVDRRHEVAQAVRAVVDLVQRPTDPLRYRDIAIIVRDLEPYHDLLSAALSAHGVPFFIDQRRSTRHHPLVQAVRALLDLHGETSFDAAIVALLKSGLSGLTDTEADAVENYTLACGPATPEAWAEEWTHPADPRERDPESPAARAALAELNRLRRGLLATLGDWRPRRETAGRTAACRAWAVELYGVLRRLAVADRLAGWTDEAAERGDLNEAAEHRQAWSDFVELLEELVAILGEEPLTGRQFREVVQSGLEEFTLGLVPATVDQVLVGSIERSRHPPVRAVFLLGFADGVFPARHAEDDLLGDAERQYLEGRGVRLGRNRRRQVFDERMLAYIAVTRPAELLWVSYPESDEEGRETRPSTYWPWLRAAAPEAVVEQAAADGPTEIGTLSDLAGGLALHFAERPPTGDLERRDGLEAVWAGLYQWARADPAASVPLRQALAALAPPAAHELKLKNPTLLWPPPFRTSITALEDFARCPFQHFARHGLRLRPRPERGLSPLDFGTLYHEVLEQFVNELMESGRVLRDLAPADLARQVHRLSEQSVGRLAEQVRLEEHERRHTIWRGDLDLTDAMTGQQATLGRAPLRPLATEQSFGLSDEGLPALELRTPNGQTVVLRGKIDRVDITASTAEPPVAVVLDYKLGPRPRLDLNEVYHGLALQLLAYLLVIRDHGERLSGTRLIPGAAFYLPLTARYVSVPSPEAADNQKIRASFKPHGIIDFDWVQRLDPDLQTGRSSIFNVFLTQEGRPGHLNRSDGVPKGTLPALLDFVRRKMGELADQWLAGDIGVHPTEYGGALPCGGCEFRAVCRFDYRCSIRKSCAKKPRSQVLAEITGNSADV